MSHCLCTCIDVANDDALLPLQLQLDRRKRYIKPSEIRKSAETELRADTELRAGWENRRAAFDASMGSKSMRKLISTSAPDGDILKMSSGGPASKLLALPDDVVHKHARRKSDFDVEEQQQV